LTEFAVLQSQVFAEHWYPQDVVVFFKTLFSKFIFHGDAKATQKAFSFFT
jgi:hypothetical protein